MVALIEAEYKDMIHFSWYHFLLIMALTFMYYMDLLLLPVYDKAGYSSRSDLQGCRFLHCSRSVAVKSTDNRNTFPILAKAFADDRAAQKPGIFSKDRLLICWLPQ